MLHAHYFSLSLLLSLLLLSLSLLLSPSSCLTLLLSSFLSLAVFCAIFVWPWHINCRTVKRLKRIAALPQQQLGNSLVHPLPLPVTVPLPPPFPPPCTSSCWLLATFAQFINSLLGFKVSPAAPPPRLLPPSPSACLDLGIIERACRKLLQLGLIVWPLRSTEINKRNFIGKLDCGALQSKQQRTGKRQEREREQGERNRKRETEKEGID